MMVSITSQMTTSWGNLTVSWREPTRHLIVLLVHIGGKEEEMLKMKSSLLSESVLSEKLNL